MLNLLKPGDYHSQKNNANDPMNECGNTSCANYLKASNLWHYQSQGEALDNMIYRILREPICQAFTKRVAPSNIKTPERVPEVLAFVLTMLTGKEHIKTTALGIGNLEDMLNNSYPAILLGSFYKNIPYGHFVTLTGFCAEGNFYIADPYAGYNIKYTESELLKKWQGGGKIAVIQKKALQ